ncbi:MAG TPA: cytochrome P450 [Thermoanaerobaculia bacterium]|nr:cytochrome P450 [Thermoanaerobaculia bacterium]
MTSATAARPSLDPRVPPGPRPHLILGNLPEFGRDTLGFFSGCTRDYGDVVRVSLGGRPAFILNHPDHFESVLVTNHRNFIKHRWFWRHVRTLFGNGLLVSEGDEWVQQRKLMQPAFHRERISEYGRVMIDFTERMLAQWHDGQTRDTHLEMMRLTMDIVVRTLFGMEVSGIEASDVAHAFDIAVKQIAVRFTRPFFIPDWVPLPNNVRFRRAIQGLDRLMDRIIADRRKTPGDDLLSMLIELGMNDRELRDQAITMFLAGHETTALAMSWTWYLLSQHPDVESKLHGELDDVLGDRPLQPEDAERLPFTRAVVLESMRLYPPAYAFGREAIHDCEIGGYHIPAGSTVFMVPWVVHRDPRWFRDPERFDPSRWDGDFAKSIPPFAYLPFGGGPRRCIGNSFATMEAILLLAQIARRFRLRLADDQRVEPFPTITLRPRYGMRMVITNRAAEASSTPAA